MQRIVFPPTREEFEKYIRTSRFYPEAIELSLKAWDWAGKWHKGIMRTDGSEYPDHPRTAAWSLLKEFGVTDPETIILALLHDVGEVKHRRPPTHKALCRAFNYRIAYKVEALAKRPGQDVAGFSQQFFNGGTKVVIAKFADQLHNLRTLAVCEPEKQKRKVIEIMMFYNPDVGNYQKFFDTASPKDVRIVKRIWTEMLIAIEELGLLALTQNTRG